MAELPKGYHDIPEEDRKKADVFFKQGAKVAGTGNYEYAIEMYLQGLAIDPDAKEAHQALREISLKRKASGGKDFGMFEKMKVKSSKTKDDREAMLKYERLMSYDPGNPDNMVELMKSAHKAGFYDTVVWIGAVLLRANSDLKNPDIKKFIVARDVYIDLDLWRQAVDACQLAVNLKPDDMELQRISKDLGAKLTLDDGGYEKSGSFRHSVKDMVGQKKLMDQDMDIRDADVINRLVADAEAEYAAAPNDAAKLGRLVDALVKSEEMERENRAIELLQQWFEKTKQFRYRFSIGRIKIGQLRRQDRAERLRLRDNPNDESLRKQYLQFVRERNEEELKEYQLFAEAYPTDMTFRYEIGVRLFNLDRAVESIALLQQARSDPKLRVEAATFLGRAFMASGFADEAIDTLKQTMEEYELRGDARSKELFYWYGRALEEKGDSPTALKAYSQLVQWDFNYRDVQGRIKKLRAASQSTEGAV